MDFKFKIFARIPLLYIFIMRRFAGNTFLKKKVRGQADKNALKFSVEI